MSRCSPQALHELQQAHHDVRSAIALGGLELEHHLPGAVNLPVSRQRRDAGARIQARWVG